MKKPSLTGYQRVIVTLPRPLAAELRKCAVTYRSGNKSGFVADALTEHIQLLRKVEHTRTMRESYAAAAELGRRIAKEWEPIDNEAWALLDRFEQGRPAPKRRKKKA